MATIINIALSARLLSVDARPLELVPGPNRVDDALWLRARDNPIVAEWVEDGTLVERNDLSAQDFASEQQLAEARARAEIERREWFVSSPSKVSL